MKAAHTAHLLLLVRSEILTLESNRYSICATLTTFYSLAYFEIIVTTVLPKYAE